MLNCAGVNNKLKIKFLLNSSRQAAKWNINGCYSTLLPIFKPIHFIKYPISLPVQKKAIEKRHHFYLHNYFNGYLYYNVFKGSAHFACL